MQLRHGVRGVRESASLDLHVGDLETRLVLNRETDHRKTVALRSQRRGAVRGTPRRDEQHAIEVRAFHRKARRRHVTFVNRIERAAKDAQPHGWYSNSASPMRTVSPGCTPSASSAAFTTRGAR